MSFATTRIPFRPSARQAIAIACLLSLLSCTTGERVDLNTPIDESLFELEFTRCEPEPTEETLEDLGEPLFGDERQPLIVAEYRIRNLDTVRRRFKLRATMTDANGATTRFTPHDTKPLDPNDASTGKLRVGDQNSLREPFTCAAEVFNSVVDLAFPDD